MLFHHQQGYATLFLEPHLISTTFDTNSGRALPLYGYQGDERSERAQLVVRRKHIGAASNDLGFARTTEGYTPIISEYDQRTLHEGKFVTRLRTAYNERVVAEMQKRLRGTLRREQQGKLLKMKIRF